MQTLHLFWPYLEIFFFLATIFILFRFYKSNKKIKNKLNSLEKQLKDMEKQIEDNDYAL